MHKFTIVLNSFFFFLINYYNFNFNYFFQKTWRKYRKSISKSSATTRPVSKKSSIDYSLEEIDFEYDSDDMERVNVVRKGHRDYVPPIPDFIDDFDSFKDENTVDVMKNLKNISFENEDE